SLAQRHRQRRRANQEQQHQETQAEQVHRLDRASIALPSAANQPGQPTTDAGSEATVRPASAWRSRTILSGLAHHAVTVDLVTTFVTRDDAAGGVLRPSRMAAALAARSEGEPAARTEVIAARRAAMRHRARRVLAEPQLNRRVFAGGDGAVTGLAFCPDLVAFFREAEARAAPAVVARYVPVAREIHLWGSVARGQALDLGARTSADRPGSAVAVTLETAARHGDGTLLATGTARFERV
ncbi:MAG: hypothetical protein AAFZ09_01875, partial [Pseudomonadota bacterium]